MTTMTTMTSYLDVLNAHPIFNAGKSEIIFLTGDVIAIVKLSLKIQTAEDGTKSLLWQLPIVSTEFYHSLLIDDDHPVAERIINAYSKAHGVYAKMMTDIASGNRFTRIEGKKANVKKAVVSKKELTKGNSRNSVNKDNTVVNTTTKSKKECDKLGEFKEVKGVSQQQSEYESNSDDYEADVVDMLVYYDEYDGAPDFIVDQYIPINATMPNQFDKIPAIFPNNRYCQNFSNRGNVETLYVPVPVKGTNNMHFYLPLNCTSMIQEVSSRVCLNYSNLSNYHDVQLSMPYFDPVLTLNDYKRGELIMNYYIADAVFNSIIDGMSNCDIRELELMGGAFETTWEDGDQIEAEVFPNKKARIADINKMIVNAYESEYTIDGWRYLIQFYDHQHVVTNTRSRNGSDDVMTQLIQITNLLLQKYGMYAARYKDVKNNDIANSWAYENDNDISLMTDLNDLKWYKNTLYNICEIFQFNVIACFSVGSRDPFFRMPERNGINRLHDFVFIQGQNPSGAGETMSNGYFDQDILNYQAISGNSSKFVNSAKLSTYAGKVVKQPGESNTSFIERQRKHDIAKEIVKQRPIRHYKEEDNEFSSRVAQFNDATMVLTRNVLLMQIRRDETDEHFFSRIKSTQHKIIITKHPVPPEHRNGSCEYFSYGLQPITRQYNDTLDKKKQLAWFVDNLAIRVNPSRSYAVSIYDEPIIIEPSKSQVMTTILKGNSEAKATFSKNLADQMGKTFHQTFTKYIINKIGAPASPISPDSIQVQIDGIVEQIRKDADKGKFDQKYLSNLFNIKTRLTGVQLVGAFRGLDIIYTEKLSKGVLTVKLSADPVDTKNYASKYFILAYNAVEILPATKLSCLNKALAAYNEASKRITISQIRDGKMQLEKLENQLYSLQEKVVREFENLMKSIASNAGSSEPHANFMQYLEAQIHLIKYGEENTAGTHTAEPPGYDERHDWMVDTFNRVKSINIGLNRTQVSTLEKAVTEMKNIFPKVIEADDIYGEGTENNTSDLSDLTIADLISELAGNSMIGQPTMEELIDRVIDQDTIDKLEKTDNISPIVASNPRGTPQFPDMKRPQSPYDNQPSTMNILKKSFIEYVIDTYSNDYEFELMDNTESSTIFFQQQFLIRNPAINNTSKPKDMDLTQWEERVKTEWLNLNEYRYDQMVNAYRRLCEITGITSTATMLNVIHDELGFKELSVPMTLGILMGGKANFSDFINNMIRYNKYLGSVPAQAKLHLEKSVIALKIALEELQNDIAPISNPRDIKSVNKYIEQYVSTQKFTEMVTKHLEQVKSNTGAEVAK